MTKMNAAKIWSLNYHLLMAIITAATAGIETLGLEIKEFFVLADIEECPYPAELASRLCIPKPTITVYLKSLEASGFVQREIDPQDLRRHRLRVTSKGRKAVTQARAILSGSFGARLERLTAVERDDFKRLLEKLN